MDGPGEATRGDAGPVGGRPIDAAAGVGAADARPAGEAVTPPPPEGERAADVEPTGGPGSSEPGEVDLGRRRFFGEFMREAVQAAASVVGAANALQRTSSQTAGALLGLGEAPSPTVPPLPPEEPFVPPPAAGFRSPFRMEADRLVLLDQRRFPDDVVEIGATSGAEVAAAMRERSVQGSATIAQVGAYGLCLTAERARTSMPFARRAMIRGTAQALRDAAPVELLLRRAIDRLLAAYEALGDLSEDGPGIAERLRAEADDLALDMPGVHARLGAVGRLMLPEVTDRPLRVVTVGSTGPLACGLVGSAFEVVRGAVEAGREVEVFVGESRPWPWAGRLAAWELAQAGITHSVVPDAALGWLLASRTVDVVLVGASRIARNGDVAGAVGTYPLAVLAARHGVPVHVCAPLATIDPQLPAGAALAEALRPDDELATVAGRRLLPPGTTVLGPAFDVTPAELVTGFVTEHGFLRPPFETAFEETLAAAGLLPLVASGESSAASDESSAASGEPMPAPGGGR
ncbi:MAG TPA: hypothetical protein VF763_11540 [Candidatus Limnocylindrales bacterium]